MSVTNVQQQWVVAQKYTREAYNSMQTYASLEFQASHWLPSLHKYPVCPKRHFHSSQSNPWFDSHQYRNADSLTFFASYYTPFLCHKLYGRHHPMSWQTAKPSFQTHHPSNHCHGHRRATMYQLGSKSYRR